MGSGRRPRGREAPRHVRGIRLDRRGRRTRCLRRCGRRAGSWALLELDGVVAAAGVFVSAHRDVILRLGTKQVLVDTRELRWGTDTRRYATANELRPRLVTLDRPIVLKQLRGMGSHGVCVS